MTSSRHCRARRGFTLIELLTVITIIGILAALTFAITKGVTSSQNTARTRGDILLIGQKLEAFKSYYGEYPMNTGGANDTEGWQRLLYECLSGLKVYKVQDNQLQLVNYENASDVPGKTPVRRPYLTEAEVNVGRLPSGAIPEESSRYFVDAWENPYAYRYSTLSGGKPSPEWERPGFLLVSAGDKYHDPVENSDYFTGSMESTGAVPESYFDDEYRADNITNWKQE